VLVRQANLVILAQHKEVSSHIDGYGLLRIRRWDLAVSKGARSVERPHRQSQNRRSWLKSIRRCSPRLVTERESRQVCPGGSTYREKFGYPPPRSPALAAPPARVGIVRAFVRAIARNSGGKEGQMTRFWAGYSGWRYSRWLSRTTSRFDCPRVINMCSRSAVQLKSNISPELK
jgi:hypothetical protein